MTKLIKDNKDELVLGSDFIEAEEIRGDIPLLRLGKELVRIVSILSVAREPGDQVAYRLTVKVDRNVEMPRHPVKIVFVELPEKTEVKKENKSKRKGARK